MCFMICDKCGYQLGKDVSYCPRFGNSTQNQIIEKGSKQYCPRCGKPLDAENDFCGECGFNIRINKRRNITPHSGKTPKLLLISLAVIIVLLAAIVVCLLISQSEKEKLTKNNVGFNQETTHINKMDRENGDKDEEGIILNDESSLKESRTDKNYADYELEEPRYSNSEENEKIYSFRSGERNLITEPTYITVSNDQFSYYCHVPSHFVKDDASDNIVYYSPDKTAVMEIIASNNTDNKSVSDVMNDYITSVGGEVTYSASGESWFAISIRKDDIAYYIKGFVDDYIREFTFDFPAEYLDVYDDYINHIEDNFKRTNR